MQIYKKNILLGTLVIILIAMIIYLWNEVKYLKKEHNELEHRFYKALKSERIDHKTFALKVLKEYRGLVAYVNYTHNLINENMSNVERKVLELNRTCNLNG